MAKQLLVLVAALILPLMLRATYAGTMQINQTGTVYDLLEQNNLPRGLLPVSVQSYVLGAGGALNVTLSGECITFVTFLGGRKFEFAYASNVSGVIKPRSISSISGVSVQVEFVWHILHQVTRAAKQLKFQLGNNTRWSIPVSAFTEIPPCYRGIKSSTTFAQSPVSITDEYP